MGKEEGVGVGVAHVHASILTQTPPPPPRQHQNRLKDFLKDALFSQSLAKTGTRHLSHSQDLLAYALILLPPLAVAIIAPDIFFSALDNAGAFGIACLFGGSAVVRSWSQTHWLACLHPPLPNRKRTGIYPAAMAYIARRRHANDAADDYITLVRGLFIQSNSLDVLAGISTHKKLKADFIV